MTQSRFKWFLIVSIFALVFPVRAGPATKPAEIAAVRKAAKLGDICNAAYVNYTDG